jgi:hypothetical protein
MKTDTFTKLLYTAFLIFCAAGTYAQGVITTFAGNGTAGYSGDGGPANMAQLSSPYGVCLDAAGNLYIADQGNYAIRKICYSTGIITTVAGNGTSGFSGDGGAASSSVLGSIQGICTDENDNIYFSDAGNNAVRKIDAITGIITTIAGNGNPGFSGDGGQGPLALLNNPEGLCISSGSLYIADTYNGRIRKLNLSTGIITTIAGNGNAGYSGDGGPGIMAMLNGPSAICANANGYLFIADEENFVVRSVAPGTGIISTIAGTGTYGFTGDGGKAVNAGIGSIDGMCMDGNGSIYIDDLSCSVRKITVLTDIIKVVAGSGVASGDAGDGGPAVQGLLSLPAGVCVDHSGNIIIADAGNNRVRMATQPGYNPNLPIYTNPVIFPNPSSGPLSVQIADDQKNATAEIFNIAGQKVYTSQLQSDNNSFDLSAMPCGPYIISVTSPGHSYTQKITLDTK